MADTSKITLKQLKDAMNKAKKYTDNEIAGVTGVSKVEPEELDMPKVFFNGDKPTDKTAVHATIEYISKTQHFKGYVDIKCQGTSSMAYPKKNYTIKMFSDETRSTKLKKDFKGWGKQSKFCLKANYIDHSHARNIVSAKLWDEIVASRTNYTELPELLRTSPCNGAIDGFPIKVYYNNIYEGVYTWNIPKDKWMFNMDDALDNHCVLCGEEYGSGCFRSANASLWSDEIHDVMPESIKTSFNNFISFVMNSSDDEFKTNLENYVYVDSLIDYYIFQYVICGLDSMGKNQLFATYDGTKWIATSYDMDSTFGLYWNGTRFVSATYRMQEDYESMTSGRPGNLLYIRMEQSFCDEIKARYAELRADILSYANIVNEFERFMDTIGKDLFAEDLTIYTGIPSGNTNNIQQIRNYTRDRLTYVDTQIEALRKLIPCTGIVLSADTLSFTTTDTQTLSVVVSPENCTDTVTWSVSPTGIVTVKNGVVTPIRNGEATITATCGSYSDTCAVTVSGISEQPSEQPSDKPIQSGLTHYFNFTTQPNDGTVTEVEDLTGSGAKFVLNNFEFDSNNGFIDNALVLSGNDEYALCDNFTIDTSNDFTLELIDSYDSVRNSNADAKILSFGEWKVNKYCFGFGYYCLLWRNSAYSTINELLLKFPTYDENGVQFTGGEFKHRIYTWDSSNKTMYLSVKCMIDGVKKDVNIASATAPIDLASIDNVFLGLKSDSNAFAAGKVKMIRVYNRKLTDEEIRHNMEVGVGYSGGGTDTTLLYSLPEETVFNGTSTYIDTGVALLSTDQDFTIALDVTPAVSQVNNYATIFHCMHEENPYPGLAFMADNTGNTFYIPKGNNSSTIGQNPYLISESIRTKVVIIKEGTTLSAYSSNSVTGSSNYTYTQVSENLLIGAYQTTNGTKGRYFSGTVHDFKIYNKVFTSEEKDAYLIINDESSRVFKIDSTCMNTADNTLIDNIAGISATLTGNPTVSGNQIVFTADDKFSFDISSLNLTNSNRTIRIKFTPTTLDTALKNIIGIGNSNNVWANITSSYITSEKLILQHGTAAFTNNTVGSPSNNYGNNRLTTPPVTGQEYELVISEHINGNIRWFIDGTLVQNGTTTLFAPLYLSNTESNNRFIGSYSLIEIYNGYCNDYTKFTNMVNNASSDVN